MGQKHADRYGNKQAQLERALRQRLQQIIKSYRPRKSLYLAFDGPAPLSKATLQQKRRLKESKSKSKGLSMAVTPGCALMAGMHSAARIAGDAWLERAPHGEFTLSSSNVPVIFPARFINTSSSCLVSFFADDSSVQNSRWWCSPYNTSLAESCS
jgi:hypothetical protein